MHDPADRNTNSISSSMMLASPNRLLNLHPPKLSRTSQQQNLSKKMKISHMNGVRPTSQEGNLTVRSSKSDTSLRCPLRQTLPIFKQPVTYYPIQRDEVKPQVINSNNQTTTNNTSGGKPSEKTKPRQLFWEKRFQNIRPTDIDGQPFEHFKLPEQIKGAGLDMSPETVVISLATSLHLYSNSRALFGQNKQFQKNPTIYVQRDQPLIEHVTITDEHIRAQEEKVNELRRRIQQTMRSNNNSADVKMEA
jgi:methyl-CpG-binding domain protein 2